MKIIDLQNNNSKSLILFFNGWGFDEQCVKHLQTNVYDVKVVFDFSDIEPISTSMLSSYKSVTVIAWSFGVRVADIALSNVTSLITNAYAINGTSNPVSDLYGIPQNIFIGTLNSLTETSYRKFLERIMGGTNRFEQNISYLPNRIFSEQKQELESLHKHFNNNKTTPIHWNKAICSSIDRIFPFANQTRFWGNKAIEKATPHFIFDNYYTWEDLIKEFLND